MKIRLFPRILAIGIFLYTASALAQLPSGDEFEFIRIRWRDNGIRYGYGFSTNAALWAHDYPTAEDNLNTILRAYTSIRVPVKTKILTFDDEEIFNYPFIYACEIGYLTLSDEEVANLREYILRGGFLMVDDFRWPYEWENWRREIKKVLPEFRWQRLTVSHPIFHCFFDMKDIHKLTPYLRVPPEYWAIVDDEGRIVVLINFNNDVGDGWELPNDTPAFSTEAYMLGINYLIYQYTH